MVLKISRVNPEKHVKAAKREVWNYEKINTKKQLRKEIILVNQSIYTYGKGLLQMPE